MPPIVIAGLLIAAGLGPFEAPLVYVIVLTTVMVFFSAACVIQGDLAEAVFGKKDHGNVVADETAGQCVTLLPFALLPAGAFATPAVTMFSLVFAFLAFRAMDIVKPWPADRLQAVPGGWGVLIDDLFAGAYAFLIVLAVAHAMA